jgi:hypothetical protein
MIQLEDIRIELGEYLDKSDDTITYSIHHIIEKFAIQHFGRLPYMNQLTDRIFDKINPDNDALELYNSDCTEEEYRERNQNIDLDKTIENIIEKFPDTIVYSYKACKIHDKILFHDMFIYHDGIFYMDTPDIPQSIYDCIIEKEYKPQIRWVLRNSRGNLENKYMEITPLGGVEYNYNDDFKQADEKIQKLLYEDRSCIMILHGKPGTGKTSYIRSLIANNPDIKFYWIDCSMFAFVDSSEFIEFISTCKNAVFILEDSESLLQAREDKKNPGIQTLLNISDGMLGDSLKLKFICTFNTDSKNIDKALLRKGRLKVKYEFKDLKKDKVEKIFEKMGVDRSLASDMPLCDVYYYLEDNGYNKETKKIGFT